LPALDGEGDVLDGVHDAARLSGKRAHKPWF
jgi:hypothetical protein